MQVFFGPRERPHGPYNLPREAALGLITTPVVLVGAMIVVDGGRQAPGACADCALVRRVNSSRKRG